ncbi:MAG TPA: hypothetical protein VFM57_03400 [Thermoleophilaceae bacterium]|nr:hypothetical protein [Thermoleophilaceae bacterium]
MGVVAGLWLAAELIGGAILLQQFGLGAGSVLAAVVLIAFAADPVARRRGKGGSR